MIIIENNGWKSWTSDELPAAVMLTDDGRAVAIYQDREDVEYPSLLDFLQAKHITDESP